MYALNQNWIFLSKKIEEKNWRKKIKIKKLMEKKYSKWYIFHYLSNIFIFPLASLICYKIILFKFKVVK